MSWMFEIYRDPDGHYRWRLLASNRNVVAISGLSYSSAANARRAIEQVRTLASDAVIEQD